MSHKLAKPKGALGPRRKSLMLLITDSDVKTAIKVMRDQMKSGAPRDKITCAQYLLDQRFGKARQSVELSGKDGESFRIIIGGREESD